MAPEDSEVAVPSMSLRDFIQLIKRRKTIAFIVFACVVALVMARTLLSKPLYVSSASVLLEEKGAPGAGGDLADIFAPQAGMAIESQVELLRSPLILNKVFEKTKIVPGSVEVGVNRFEKTSKIDITGTSKSEQDVQAFVSMVPQVYEENRREESAREVTAELEFAKQNLAQENQKLLDIEAATVKFKNDNNLVDPNSEISNVLSVISASRASLAAARAELSKLRAQIQALEGQVATLPPTVETPVVTTNPVIQQLRNELAARRSERTEQLFLYKPNADPIRQLDLQIAELEARIARTPPDITNDSTAPNPNVAETRNRIAGLRADLSAQEASARVLARQVETQQQGLGRYTEIQRQQAQLQRDFDATQTAVTAGGEKVRVLSVRAQAMKESGGKITVIEPGTPAIKVSANPARNLIIALFLGALLASAAALIQDSLDDRVRDEEEARNLLGAPVLGYFPLLPVSDERQILDLDNPDRLLLETFRALRSNVQFALVNSTGKKLQVTSTVPNEGKSYIASNLAITMALDGRRVILVDADLHKPTMHERFGALRQPGLTNVLVGQATVDEALQDSGFANLQLMSAGALPPNSAELLNSPMMMEVMKQLEGQADLVIFDTPPLLATSDSQLMSAKMDGTIFVMQMGSVARSGTLRAFELLKQANANLIGIVFNKVDSGKNSNSYESYSGYYAVDGSVPEDEILRVKPEDPPVKSLTAGNGSSAHISKNGGSPNGSHLNGSNGSTTQATIFDEAIDADENSG